MVTLEGRISTYAFSVEGWSTNIQSLADITVIQVRNKESLSQRFLSVDIVTPGEGGPHWALENLETLL